MFREIGLPVIGAIIFVIVIMSIGAASDASSCRYKWGQSGMPLKWSLFGGCKISTDGGKTWIPDATYRRE